MALQFSIMGTLFVLRRLGSDAARSRSFPYFLVFPVAFTLNRLGQHYNIDPTHPLKWATLMKPSHFWDFLFVYSNYHLEHHYFPRVPFYNLRKVHMRLRPLYDRLGLKPHTYREHRLAVVRAEPGAAYGLGTRRRRSARAARLRPTATSASAVSSSRPAGQVAARVATR